MYVGKEGGRDGQNVFHNLIAKDRLEQPVQDYPTSINLNNFL